jgi:hypothetical protein
MLKQRKTPDLDRITARMLKELPKGLVNPMYIFNTTLRLEYWAKSLNISEIVMTPKPGKKIQWMFHPTDQSAYCRHFQKY